MNHGAKQNFPLEGGQLPLHVPFIRHCNDERIESVVRKRFNLLTLQPEEPGSDSGASPTICASR